MKRSLGKKLAVWMMAAVMAAAGSVTVWAATRLDTVSDAYWDDESENAVAVWEEVDEAYQYEVYLYCNDSKVADIKTKKTKYNFEKKMTKEGEYTFRVRALAKKSDRDYSNGSWSDYSDGLYISSDYAELVKNGGKIDTENSGPGAKNPAEAETAAAEGTGAEGSTTETADGSTAAAADGSVAEAADGSTAGTEAETSAAENAAEGTGAEDAASGSGAADGGAWVQDETGWWYRNADGTYPANCWFQDPGDANWYCFDEAGYMRTGWIDLDGKRYYCDAYGTPSGAMVTGEKYIGDSLFVFDESGALIDE